MTNDNDTNDFVHVKDLFMWQFNNSILLPGPGQETWHWHGNDMLHYLAPSNTWSWERLDHPRLTVAWVHGSLGPDHTFSPPGLAQHHHIITWSREIMVTLDWQNCVSFCDNLALVCRMCHLQIAVVWPGHLATSTWPGRPGSQNTCHQQQYTAVTLSIMRHI